VALFNRVLVSPLVKENMAKHFEVQIIDEDINTPTSIEQARFMELLNVPRDRLPSKPSKRSDGHLTYENFLEAVNHVAKSIQGQCECLPLYSLSCRISSLLADFTDKDTLIFKSTENQSHGGPIADTRCRPDFVVAFKSDWKTEYTTLWPCIHLVGKII
jgi:hypothetical protein